MEREEEKEIHQRVEEEIRRLIARGELARTEDPEAARLARFYGVVPAAKGAAKGKAVS